MPKKLSVSRHASYNFGAIYDRRIKLQNSIPSANKALIPTPSAQEQLCSIGDICTQAFTVVIVSTYNSNAG
jgi:hypothetical protein